MPYNSSPFFISSETAAVQGQTVAPGRRTVVIKKILNQIFSPPTSSGAGRKRIVPDYKITPELGYYLVETSAPRPGKTPGEGPVRGPYLFVSGTSCYCRSYGGVLS